MSSLGLLQDLFLEIAIPREVFQEVVVRGSGRPGAIEVTNAMAGWIRVRTPSSLVPVPAELDLDLGEWEAISLASEIRPDYLLIDDRRAVKFARSLGIAVLTTPSVFVLAKEAGLIDSVTDRLDALRSTGFWIRDSVYQTILQSCGEAKND